VRKLQKEELHNCTLRFISLEWPCERSWDGRDIWYGWGRWFHTKI